MTFSMSGTVILFAIGLTFATGLLFGLFPALHSTRPDLVSTLKNQAGQPSGAKGAARVRLLLATSQIALSMMLLASSGFFVKSLLNVSRVDLGFKVDHVVTFGLSPDLNGYSSDRTRLFFQRLEDELRAAPGVTAVTVSNVPLLAGRTGQEVSPSRGSTPDPTPTATPATTESVRATSPRSASRSSPDASSPMPTRSIPRRSLSSTRRSRRSSAWGTTPSAS